MTFDSHIIKSLPTEWSRLIVLVLSFLFLLLLLNNSTKCSTVDNANLHQICFEDSLVRFQI